MNLRSAKISDVNAPKFTIDYFSIAIHSWAELMRSFLDKDLMELRLVAMELPIIC